MYKSFLIKYAEIGVKGKNRYLFEEALVKQIKYALKKAEGEFLVRRTDGASMWMRSPILTLTKWWRV